MSLIGLNNSKFEATIISLNTIDQVTIISQVTLVLWRQKQEISYALHGLAILNV